MRPSHDHGSWKWTKDGRYLLESEKGEWLGVSRSIHSSGGGAKVKRGICVLKGLAPWASGKG